MDVKFIQTTFSKLNSLSIVDGQIVALSDQSGLYYDLAGKRYACALGQVQLSDNYIQSDGNASSGVAASSYALNSAYNAISSHYGVDSNGANLLKSTYGTRVVNSDNSEFVAIQAKAFITAGGSDLEAVLERCDNTLVGAPTKTDLLNVSLTDPMAEANKVHVIGTSDASTLTNSPVPSGDFYAKWECIFYGYSAGDGTRLMVKVTEFYPVQGRIWYNHFNWTTWTGWVSNWNRVTDLQTHTSNKSNPHGITPSQIGAPSYLSGVVITDNLGGIGTSTYSGQYWKLWNLQDGDNYWAAFVPSKDLSQDIGYANLRVRSMYAGTYYGDWGGGYSYSNINILDKLHLKADGEGGNIRFISADGLHHWEMDAYANSSIRLYHGTNSGHTNGAVEYDMGFTFDSTGDIYSNKGTFINASNIGSQSVAFSEETGKLRNVTSDYYLALNSEYNVKPYRRSTGLELDSIVALGSSAARWKHIYALNGIISTSDRNAKDNIAELTDTHKQFFMKLIPVSFTFKDGTSGRTHIGFISQDVEQAMEELGMTSLDFAGFCKDKKVKCKLEKVPVLDEDGNIKLDDVGNEIYEDKETSTLILDEDGNPEYIYSLRYEEFIALNSFVIKDTVKRVDDLERRLIAAGL